MVCFASSIHAGHRNISGIIHFLSTLIEVTPHNSLCYPYQKWCISKHWFIIKLMSFRRNVAIYARVSTKAKLQNHSITNQIAHLKSYIDIHDNLILSTVYVDFGFSGTNTTNRPAFNKMINNANNIDLILVKSVSRFSRNTLELLQTTRLLKNLNTEVYFVTEKISSLDPKSELILSILASLAQEESRNLSENILWGIKRKMEKGEFSLPYSRFLGYKKDKSDNLIIVTREANIVKHIYRLYLYGYSITSIANIMNKKHISTPGGQSIWRYNTVYRILTNEKYKGEALLQKTYTKDYFTHKNLKKLW